MVNTRSAFLYLTTALAVLPPATALAADQPNILLVMADDMGYSDLGAFGGEIQTPNLDALAQRGLRLTNFHAMPLCAPTRSELLTGTDAHIAGEGWMGGGPPVTQGKPGYQDYLNTDVASVAELLHAGGYYTVMAGKWHLGVPIPYTPAGRGFEHSFALLGGAWLHFAPNAATPANPLVDDTKFEEDGQYVKVPADFYSSDFYAQKIIQYLGAQKAAGDARPFFAYLPFTAPHWPLQAPADIRNKYAGVYDDGPEKLREQRLAQQVALGLLTPAQAADAHKLQFGTPWNQLSLAEKAVSARKMEVYAAMVDRMDTDLGRVVRYLKGTGQLENTVVIFLADNGAEGSDFTTKIGAGFDNSYSNIGRVNSFTQYGIYWAQAATAPHKLEKEYTAEGGIHTPAFVTWGSFARQGGISNAYLDVKDITPTILNLAGIGHPATFGGHPIAPLEGQSWLPFLNRQAEAVHSSEEVLGWEQWGQRAVRIGNLKGVYEAEPNLHQPHWQVFDLAADPGENTDVGLGHPEKVQLVRDLWADWARRNQVILVDPITPGYDSELFPERY